MRVLSKVLLVGPLLLVLALCLPARAVRTETWRNEGLENFAKGKLEGVSINVQGWLRLAPEQENLARPEAQFVWSLAEDKEGNIYAGTGPKGIIYKVGADGTLSEFAQTGDMNVHALAVNELGVVYAGTAPSGKIFRIEPGKLPEVLFETKATYVWDMLFEDDGSMVVATGKPGSVRRIAPDGKETVLYDGKDTETHCLCLLNEKPFGLLTGTAPNGLLLKLEGGGRSTVLLDAAEPEIQDIVSNGHDRLFAVTASGGEAMAEGGAPKPAEGASAEPAGEETREAGENSVYLVVPGENRTVRALGLKQTSLFAAAFTKTGGLYIGTGDEGNLIRISADLGLELIVDLDERQILSMLVTRDGRLLLGTANGALIARISDGFRLKGDYLSTPLDSKWGAKWGRLAWTGRKDPGGDVAFSTRSGNTAKPDATWGEWEAVTPRADGSVIETKGGRYLQYRASITTDSKEKSPVVESVSVSYLPNNLAPKIKKLNVGSANGGDEKSGGSGGSAPSVEQPRSSVLNLSWEVDDPNGDALRHDLYFRREGDDMWTAIKRDLKETSYAWETLNVPDGPYRIILRTTDQADNTLQTAERVEQLSGRFIIDNTRPRVLRLKARDAGAGRIELSGLAMDETSQLTGLEYSVGPEQWVRVLPSDGILDSQRESFKTLTQPLRKGKYYILVKATDAEKNVGVARVVVDIDAPK